MTRALVNRGFSPGRMLSLLRSKHELDRSIEDEHSRPAPCSLTLQRLKRRRLAVKERVERLRNRQCALRHSRA